MPALTRRRHPGGSGERGFILLTALLILAALTVFIAAVARSSEDASNTSAQAVSNNQALGAADAGAQQALFRINAAGATGTTGATGSLGNGRSYSYSASPLVPPNDSSCAGLPVRGPTGASGSTGATGATTILQYCITSTGSAHGRTSKVQERVVGSQSLFPVNGLFAVNAFTAKANFGAIGNIGSNGLIDIKGASSSINGTVEYLPSAQQPAGSAPNCPNKSGTTCTLLPLPAALPIPSSTATLPSAYASALGNNINASISPSLSGYNATNYTVNDSSNNPTYVLPSGTYYFCNLAWTGNSVTLQASITNNQPVVVYIDSSSDSPRCATASPNGQLTAKNSLTIQGNGSPDMFQIYFYGGAPGCTPNCPPALTANNLTINNAQIIAPYSTFTAGNAITLNGTFVFDTVSIGANTTANFVAMGSGEGGNVTFPYYFPAAHQICNASGSC